MKYLFQVCSSEKYIVGFMSFMKLNSDISSRCSLLGLLVISLLGCDSKPVEKIDIPLVTVNGSAITEPELQFALGKFPPRATSDENVRRNLLESLVKSRAIAMTAESLLSLKEQKELDLQVARYREELLVKKHLKATIDPQPVSAEMVKSYYQQFPERFGGVDKKKFEYITVARELKVDEKNNIAGELARLKSVENWDKATKELAEKDNFPVKYQQAELNIELLQEPLKSLVEDLEPGSTPVLETDRGLYLVRVLSKTQSPAKPLAEVSAKIRKMLAPIQLKEAIKNTSEQVLTQVDVVYHEE